MLLKGKRRMILVLLLCLAAVPILAYAALGQLVRSAAGIISHTMCSEVFVSGFTPKQVFGESLAPLRAITIIKPFISYDVDTLRREVRVSIFGLFHSRAIYRSTTMGCLITHGEPPITNAGNITANHAVGSDPEQRVSKSRVRASDNLALEAALERAFQDDGSGAKRRTRAVVIVQHGKIIAERYADGIGPTTALLGYSMTKSFTNAMLGVLARQGKINIEDRAPVPEWAKPSDPRNAITIEDLMRMTSGLAIEETHTGADPVSHMLFDERDMAAFAQGAKLSAAPGSRWEYTSGNTLILSGIIRNAVGGRAEDVYAFAQRELFGPLNMSSAVLESDAMGTPIGSTYLFASARDWARLGLLYLNDGMIGDTRILPKGWVETSTKQTLSSNYGAGFWVYPNNVSSYFVSEGFLGQYMIINPSKDIVIVRLGASDLDGNNGVNDLINDVFTATTGGTVFMPVAGL
jgi:CubicO group peptidase (beta-lactamase class C family)